ncbi:hypothetical protein CRUP_022845 [Coryphaenoides rupestris]|nr:hypothetical protein CRUP_022845 [Coryphaenoides rupestris]
MLTRGCGCGYDQTEMLPLPPLRRRRHVVDLKSLQHKTQDIMVNFVSFARDHWINLLVPIGFVLGCYLDRLQDSKLTAFRNKSALYGRELKPGEEYTWK